MFLFLLLALSGVAHAGSFDPSDLAQDQGTYRFADGTCMTGGRMDENGVRLLYMDVWKNRTAVLLSSQGGELVSLIPPGLNATMDASSDTLTLTRPDGHTRVAHRLHRPDARAVHFKSGDLILAGTLYTPDNATGKLPGVVLAHGSGPVDRFGGTWITFFTNLGFAVLSYDKRGVGESQGDWHTATYVDLASDLDAAVDWLARQPDVDAARLGIHATSQSGWYAPLAAARDRHVRFLIQRVGPALWIGPVTQHENESDWRAAGVPETDIAPAAALWLRLNTLAREGGSSEQAQRLIDAAADKSWFGPTFGDGWRHIEAGAWQRRRVNAKLDPASTAARLNIPVLWFLAEKDQNVPYKKSRDAIETARQKHKADITLVTIPDAPHSFLIKDVHGAVHYTDRYWPEMARWLRAHGVSQRTFQNCGLPSNRTHQESRVQGYGAVQPPLFNVRKSRASSI